MAEASQKQGDFTEQNGEFDLPQYILEKYDSSQQVQLIKGYRLLQVLKYHPSNEPFFEKPDDAKQGSRSYYDIIKSPMWLNEIERKFFNAEYNSLLEVVKDIRLIFENCYYFWGPTSPLTHVCLHMEQLFEGRILYLPKELRNICSLEELRDKNEDEIVTKVWSRCRSKGKTCSRLMLRTLRRKRTEELVEYNEKMNLSKFCDNGDRILRWEERLLRFSDNLRFISSSRELPQIGRFIQLLSNTFNLPNVYLFEVERMLFFPQYSSLFRRIMSIIFSEDRSENSLTYEKIREKIESIIANWYQLYEIHHHSASKVSNSEGIDENFFDIIGDTNPLSTQCYEELPYYLRVVILKSIFDHISHCQSDINQIIGNTTEEKFCLQKIGRDKYGIVYVFFPIFPDIRIYRYKPKIATVSKLEIATSTDNDHGADKKSLKVLFDDVGSRFKMVADSIDGVRAIIEELFYSDVENSKKDTKISNSKIIEALQQFEERFAPEENERIRRINEIRIELFNEWLEHCESDDQLATLDEPSEEEHSDGDIDENCCDDDCDNVKSSKKLTSVIFEDISNPKAIKMRIGNRIHNECGDIKQAISETEECDSTESVHKYEAEEITGKSLGDFLSSPINEAHGEIKTKDDGKCERRTERIKQAKKLTENREDKNEVGDENSYHESFSEDIENTVKAEPIEEENIDDYCNFEDKSEWMNIKNNSENNRDSAQCELNDKERLRRNSGTFHPQVVENFEEDEFSSSEETPSSEDDSDDDWEVQNKRSRAKGGKRTRKRAARVDEDMRKRSRKRSRLENSSAVEPDSNEGVADFEETKNDSQPHKTEYVEMEEKAEKLKVKIDTLKNETELMGNDMILKESDKPPSKIKVIDLAKLQNCESENWNDKIGLSAIHSLIMPKRPTIATAVTMLPSFTPVQNTNLVGYPTNAQPRQVMSESLMKKYHHSQRPSNLPMHSAQRVLRPPALGPPVPGSQTNARSTNISLASHGTDISGNIASRNVLNANYGRLTHNNIMSNVYEQSTRGRNVPGAIPIPQMRSSVTVLRNMVQNPLHQRPSMREIQGMIGINSSSGILQYVVNLANGSHVPLSDEQVQKLRQRNGGVLPQKLKIPVPADVAEKIEPCARLGNY